MELGKRIREYRNKAGWNQDEFAEKMYVSRQTTALLLVELYGYLCTNTKC